MKLGLVLPYEGSLVFPEAVALTQRAEAVGYDSVWAPEAYGTDAISVLGALAARTDRIRLGTGIVNVFSRTPALLAQTAATLDMISDGRFILGLGTSGHQVIAGWHAAADALLDAGQGAVAEKIWGFIGGMHRPLTTDEQLAANLEERARIRERERQEERTR